MSTSPYRCLLQKQQQRDSQPKYHETERLLEDFEIHATIRLIPVLAWEWMVVLRFIWEVMVMVKIGRLKCVKLKMENMWAYDVWRFRDGNVRCGF